MLGGFVVENLEQEHYEKWNSNKTLEMYPANSGLWAHFQGVECLCHHAHRV